ncbi:uncharacterized protein LOC106151226 [Lingula anatina]|uniref:Uncharacterized protein LOC106151226 n=1 Tax=Lingula anatina TaxID=7574 RepID=A0A1S3H0Z1_LINAN|nr:uncharacterized protein LOC106151226 [Lingula anatina]|eukprot:XP_013379810.1 uncharacterized protein LOC106151226 [Lingula anatina]
MTGYRYFVVLFLIVFLESSESAGINCTVASGLPIHDVLNTTICPGSSCLVFTYNSHQTLHFDHETVITYGCADNETCQPDIIGNWRRAKYDGKDGMLFCCNENQCNLPAEMKRNHMFRPALDISSSLQCYEGNLNSTLKTCSSSLCYNVSMLDSDRKLQSHFFGCAGQNQEICKDQKTNVTFKGCREKNSTNGHLAKFCCCDSEKCNLDKALVGKPNHTSQNGSLLSLISHGGWIVTAVIVLVVIGTVFTIFTVSCVIYNRRKKQAGTTDHQPAFSYQNLQADSVQGYEQL